MTTILSTSALNSVCNVVKRISDEECILPEEYRLDDIEALDEIRNM